MKLSHYELEEMNYSHRRALREYLATHSNPLTQRECQALIETIDKYRLLVKSLEDQLNETQNNPRVSN